MAPIFCKRYFISNGRHCGTCELPHVVPSFKICTPTYMGNICNNGIACKFKHFLPSNLYCYKYLLFNRCTSLSCPYIHITQTSVTHNLFRISVFQTTDLLLDCIKRYHTDLFNQFQAEIRLITASMNTSFTIAKFRTSAKCIICHSSADEPLLPTQRYESLYNSAIRTKLPSDIMNEIRSFIIPQQTHPNCFYIRRCCRNYSTYKLYEKRLVSRYDEKIQKQVFVQRAIKTIPAVILYTGSLTISLYNLSLAYSEELADIVHKYIIDDQCKS